MSLTPHTATHCNTLQHTATGHTTLPTVVFVTPAIGLIIIGVFTFIASTIGCIGAIRERYVWVFASLFLACLPSDEYSILGLFNFPYYRVYRAIRGMFAALLLACLRNMCLVILDLFTIAVTIGYN